MNKLLIEVFGTEPPCARCNLAYKTIEKAVDQLDIGDLEVTLEKRNCADKETIGRFGVVIPPAVAVNGVIRISGRTPNESEIKQLIQEDVGGD